MRRLSQIVFKGISTSDEDEGPPKYQAQPPQHQQHHAHQVKQNIILLGTGGSGKTSILRTIHPISESIKLVDHIYENILSFPCELLGRDLKLKLDENAEFFKEFCLHDYVTYLSKSKYVWNEEFARKLYKLWWDPAFQHEWFRQRIYVSSVLESVHYFMKKKNFQRVMKHGYIPNSIDCFYCMIKTTGFSEYPYRSGYVVTDTGGQRTERKKWPNLLQDVEGKVICFVVSLGEFDELCYEDSLTNRYEEGLNSFEHWYTHELVQKFKLFIIFNKMDVLERKVRNGVRFSDFVQEYCGDNSDPESISEFIVKKYLQFNSTKNRIVKHFKISANNSAQVFNTMNEIFGIEEKAQVDQKDLLDYSLKIPSKFKKAKKQLPELIEDVVYNILQFMKLNELLEKYMFVSKKWCRAAFKVPIILFRPNLDSFINSNFQHVKSLSLQSTFLQRRHIEQLAHNPKFKTITHLNISNIYTLTSLDWKYLFDHNEFKYLETICTDYCWMFPSSLLLNLPKLINVSMSGNNLSGSKPIKKVHKEDELLELS